LIWKMLLRWERLAQDTIGKQIINSADSIGANIAEGTGRASYADNRRFAKSARGSLFELKHWLRRAFKRQLLTQSEIDALRILNEDLTSQSSAYINSIGKKTTDD
jgi:four helix bundle protein